MMGADPWDVAMDVYQELEEEYAYYREKDAEIERDQQAQSSPAILDTGMCSRCGRDAYLSGGMGGCYCV